MSDGDPGLGKSAGIPAWQLSTKSSPDQEKPDQPSVETAEETKEQHTATDSEHVQQSKQDVVEQGKRFLLDSSIRDAPLEQKRSFLEAQGLSKADIDKAVELSKTAVPSIESPQSHIPPQSQTSRMQRSTPPSPPPEHQRDVPPIITYPEFLIHSTKPPPIITANRLLTTAYTAASVSALLYGCNKYLITPLLSTLASARHDFATHSATKVEELNTKLSAIVSSPNSSHTNPLSGEPDDTASDTSDPTELFHRDYGTQTAPSLIRDDASSSSSSSSTPSTPTEASATKLASVIASCKSLSGNDIIDSADDQSTLTVIRVLHEYLESLAFPAYSGAGVYGSGQVGGYGANGERKEDDEVSRFRNEIRSVKGSLLSARNFPSTNARGGSSGSGPRGSLFPPAGNVK